MPIKQDLSIAPMVFGIARHFRRTSLETSRKFLCRMFRKRCLPRSVPASAAMAEDNQAGR